MKIKQGYALAALWMLLAICAPVRSADRDPFIVERAGFTLNKTLLELDLIAHSEVPDYIAMAIDQGFAVPFMFEVEILASKEYWLDDKIVSLKQQYLLHYLPMLGSFSVLDVNTGARSYFENRKAAVSSLEVVYNYPMLDIENLAPGRDYYAIARFGIDTDELPLPLKSSSLWDNDWDLQSDWYEWKVIRSEL